MVGIPPAPRGVPQVEVTFDIDANGIVNVSAKDKATNRDQSMTIVSSSGLNKDEIERMVSDAERFAESDSQKKELIESVNAAENTIADIEKNLQQFAAQLDKVEEQKLREQIKQLQEVMKTAEKAEEVRTRLDQLNQASMNLFQMVYQKKMNENTGNAGSGSTGTPEEAEVKDDK